MQLYLPWARYEAEWVLWVQQEFPNQVSLTVFDPEVHREWLLLARKQHPQGERLSRGSLALLARTQGMLSQASTVIAMPYVRIRERVTERSLRPQRGRIGGVVQIREHVVEKGAAELPMRFAERLDVERFDLSDPLDCERLEAALESCVPTPPHCSR